MRLYLVSQDRQSTAFIVRKMSVAMLRTFSESLPVLGSQLPDNRLANEIRTFMQRQRLVDHCTNR